jgi:putative ABC transport system permease protein
VSYIRLEWTDLLVALVLVAVAVLLAWRERVGYTKLLLVGTARTLVQLLAIGYVLRIVFFEVRAWWLNLAVLLLMVAVAAANAVRRQDHRTPGYASIAFRALLTGPAAVLAIVILLVLQVDPWFEAQYLIPLGGMIIAYAMNAITLLKNRFDSEIRLRRKEIEARLALGATSRVAARDAVRQAYRAALLPAVNAMMIVGIVQIPGMMGGQIIGGADPLDAALYQMVVMFQLTAAAVLSSFVAARLVFHRTFNRAHQLVAA